MQRHIAIYLRVSTDRQDTASQQPELEYWAGNQTMPVVWYTDHFTGKTMDRPGWNELEAAMRSGNVAAVVVWRLDRLGRTTLELCRLFEELRTSNVNLVSMKEGIDLSTPAGRHFARMLASAAEYETEVRAERQQAGIAAAKAKGKRWGGSLPGVPKKVTADKAIAIRDLHKRGMPISRIAKTVDLSRPTIYSVLGLEAVAR